MKKLNLENVTLIGIDCLNVERLQKALDISCEHIEFGAVKLLTSLPSGDPRKIGISSMSSLKEYSKFCLKDLHSYIETEHALIIQHDGFVLNAAAWEADFLKYDYIGGAWLIGEWGGDDFPKELYGKEVVGNGGFSLRSRKLLKACAELFESGALPKYDREDVAICVWYRSLFEERGISFSPVPVAKRFSCNIKDKTAAWSGEFGFHGLKENTRMRLSEWMRQNRNRNI